MFQWTKVSHSRRRRHSPPRGEWPPLPRWRPPSPPWDPRPPSRSWDHDRGRVRGVRARAPPLPHGGGYLPTPRGLHSRTCRRTRPTRDLTASRGPLATHPNKKMLPGYQDGPPSEPGDSNDGGTGPPDHLQNRGLPSRIDPACRPNADHAPPHPGGRR